MANQRADSILWWGSDTVEMQSRCAVEGIARIHESTCNICKYVY